MRPFVRRLNRDVSALTTVARNERRQSPYGAPSPVAGEHADMEGPVLDRGGNALNFFTQGNRNRVYSKAQSISVLSAGRLLRLGIATRHLCLKSSFLRRAHRSWAGPNGITRNPDF